MAKGKRLPEETKRVIANRYNKGEDKNDLASEFGVSAYTVVDYGKLYKRNPRKVKRSISAKPTENPLVKENETLRKQVAELTGKVEFWREAYNASITNR